MVEIRSFRFIIPPFVMLLIIQWARVTQEHDSLASALKHFLVIDQSLLKTTVFFSAIFFLFGFGFVISTIGTLTIKILSCIGKIFGMSGVAVYWHKEARGRLDRLFKRKDIWKEGEFCEQTVLSLGPGSMHNWVIRRYEYFQTNFNCLIAIGMAWLVLAIVNIKINFNGFMGILFLIIPLSINMGGSWYDAMKMDHLILYNLPRLSLPLSSQTLKRIEEKK